MKKLLFTIALTIFSLNVHSTVITAGVYDDQAEEIYEYLNMNCNFTDGNFHNFLQRAHTDDSGIPSRIKMGEEEEPFLRNLLRYVAMKYNYFMAANIRETLGNNQLEELLDDMVGAVNTTFLVGFNTAFPGDSDQRKKTMRLIGRSLNEFSTFPNIRSQLRNKAKLSELIFGIHYLDEMLGYREPDNLEQEKQEWMENYWDALETHPSKSHYKNILKVMLLEHGYNNGDGQDMVDCALGLLSRQQGVSRRGSRSNSGANERTIKSTPISYKTIRGREQHESLLNKYNKRRAQRIREEKEDAVIVAALEREEEASMEIEEPEDAAITAALLREREEEALVAALERAVRERQEDAAPMELEEQATEASRPRRRRVLARRPRRSTTQELWDKSSSESSSESEEEVPLQKKTKKRKRTSSDTLSGNTKKRKERGPQKNWEGKKLSYDSIKKVVFQEWKKGLLPDSDFVLHELGAENTQENRDRICEVKYYLRSKNQYEGEIPEKKLSQRKNISIFYKIVMLNLSTDLDTLYLHFKRVYPEADDQDRFNKRATSVIKMLKTGREIKLPEEGKKPSDLSLKEKAVIFCTTINRNVSMTLKDLYPSFNRLYPGASTLRNFQKNASFTKNLLQALGGIRPNNMRKNQKFNSFFSYVNNTNHWSWEDYQNHARHNTYKLATFNNYLSAYREFSTLD